MWSCREHSSRVGACCCSWLWVLVVIGVAVVQARGVLVFGLVVDAVF